MAIASVFSLIACLFDAYKITSRSKCLIISLSKQIEDNRLSLPKKG